MHRATQLRSNPRSPWSAATLAGRGEGGFGRALLALAVAVTGCSASVDRAAGGDEGVSATAIEDRQVVDLTHALSPDSLYWPNGTPFEWERQTWGYSEDGKWYAMARFSMPEHLGTHLDAPIHFAPDAWTNAEIPVRRFIGPAVLIDIAERAANNADAVLEAADLEAWEAAHGRVPEGAIVLVRSGWSLRWPDWNDYYGSDDPFDTTALHFPGVSPEAAAWIVERGVSGVGIDTASIDPGKDLDFRSHRILAAAGVFNLENLTGLEQLPAQGATLIALPIKIAGGSGGPARVVALLAGSDQ